MAKQQQENEFEKWERENPTRFEDFDGWNPETAEVLNDLLRALRRKKGFSLFFVQCSPARGKRVMQAIRERFPQKRLVQFELNRQSETLYWDLKERYQEEAFEVACVTGVEQAMYSYEDTKRLAGWSSKEIYNYSWKGVPPLLSHLNLGREVFEANLPIVLIFFVPNFAINYFVQRAPDFFDWRSGFFKFVESSDLQKDSKELVDKEFEKYQALSQEERMVKIIEIREKIIASSDKEQKSSLLREQGRLFASGHDYSQALDCYDRAIATNPNNYKAWNSKGDLLYYDIKRYKEAIAIYDHALEINPDSQDAWYGRGNAIGRLERYEEAIESYEMALKIKPEYYHAWNGRAIALRNLERYEEAIESYDRALKIKPDYHIAWANKGDALQNLERYEEAIKSYDRVLTIKPDFHYVWNIWNNRGDALRNLERYEEAIESYDRVLEIQPNFFTAWINRKNALANLKRYEEELKATIWLSRFNLNFSLLGIIEVTLLLI